ncbi:MAG TPA: TIR domain-containing protein [Thermoanaerobaculia bacterium]|nr:TIR domain-containing protein [Thermoanaerobaculia bacterium]
MTEVFDVFLSYNSKDKRAVRQLAQALRAQDVRVWLDEDELVPGRPWQDALEEIIQTARTAAVLVGKDGLGPWEIPEMRACLSEFVNRKMPVIPVLLPGAPQKPELPLFLRAFTWVDLRSGPGKGGLDRLIWGITGKKPEPRASELAKILDALRTNSPVNRADMAILIVQATRGRGFVPPPAQGIFRDVPTSHRAAAFIEQLYRERIINGHSPNLYRPDAKVLRAEIAVVLVRLIHGASYVPPRATGAIFRDVPADHWAAIYIEQLYRDGITKGCNKKPPLYCPDQPLLKEQMAIFLRRSSSDLDT